MVVRVTSPSGNIEGALSLGHSSWNTLNHGSDHVTIHNITLSSPHTTHYERLQAIGQPSRRPQENCHVSTFGLQHSGTYLGFTTQPMQQTHLTPFLPTPSQPHSTSYFTAHNYILHYASTQMPNPISQFPQGHLGSPFLVHSPDTEPADLPASQEIFAGGEMEHTTGTVDSHAAYIDHPLSDPSDHRAGMISDVVDDVPSNSVMPVPQELYFSDRFNGESTRIPTHSLAPSSSSVETTMHTPVTHLFRDSTTGMTYAPVDDRARMDPVSDQSTGSNLPSSSSSDAAHPPFELHTSKHLPHTGGGDLTIPSGSPVADHPHEHTMAHRNPIPCGWVNPNGMRCNMPIDSNCERHFAIVHGIRNIGSKKKIPCFWCLDMQETGRKNFLRHIREVHMKLPRTDIRGSHTPEKKKRKRDQSG
ncbi:hypothetical protein EDC04DRAFT_2697149 [Pisolithus marmoratus]|nr:hypothetical protein EDC04DRAFT_2697149 [Pisolithus marmoratus]